MKKTKEKQLDDKKEVRFLGEMRAVDMDNDKMIIEGYAVKYDTPATHFEFTEIIVSGALDECDMSDVPLKYNHSDENLIMARTRNKSLELINDSKGLKIRAELIDTTANQDLYKSIRSKLIDKMSFAFSVEKQEWDFEKGIRKVLKIDRLYDVSVVDVPFYDTTEIYARNLQSLENGKKELDNFRIMRAKNKFIGGKKNV